MTALIIGLIAALGIGGGVAIANNSGGGGHHTAMVQTADVAQRRAELNAKLSALAPDYDLISALTDHDQYAITLGTEGDLLEAYNQSAAGGLSRRSGLYGLNGTYDDSDGDLHKEPKLEGHEFSIGGDPVVPTINLSPENSGQIAGTSAQFYKEGDTLLLRQTAFTFTAADKNITHGNTNISTSDYYDVFVHQEPEVSTTQWNSAGDTLQKWTALYLGGAKVAAGTEHPGLTVADFGIWDDYVHTEGPSEGFHDLSEEKFIFFDEQYAYQSALRTADTVTLKGSVMAHEAEGYVSPKEILRIFTGDITLNLNLAANTLTGNVKMHEGVPAEYDINNMTGTISGSVVRFDGLAYQASAPLPTQENRFLGGMGKLLFGKYGLEMVGVLGNQIEIPADWGDRSGQELRDYRQKGDSGYVFGAREN